MSYTITIKRDKLSGTVTLSDELLDIKPANFKATELLTTWLKRAESKGATGHHDNGRLEVAKADEV